MCEVGQGKITFWITMRFVHRRIDRRLRQTAVLYSKVWTNNAWLLYLVLAVQVHTYGNIISFRFEHSKELAPSRGIPGHPRESSQTRARTARGWGCTARKMWCSWSFGAPIDGTKQVQDCEYDQTVCSSTTKATGCAKKTDALTRAHEPRKQLLVPTAQPDWATI